MATFTGILEWSRNINLNALRLLSLSLILLSFTPMASLWVLFISWGWSPEEDLHNDHDGGDTTTAGTYSANNLIAALRNPNATLEEILTLVLMERVRIGGVPTTQLMAHHWAAVIPWALSMLFGFVVPIFLLICSLIRSRRLQQERREATANYTEYRKRRRREKILAVLDNYSMTLRKEDQCDQKEAPDSKNESDTNAGKHPQQQQHSSSFWKIPHPGSIRDEDKRRRADNLTCSRSGECAICLHQYEVGHKVVWAQTTDCCHVFHQSCLVDWFAVKRRKQHLCPCCRQVFFVRPSSKQR